jgi:hypothetical protein
MFGWYVLLTLFLSLLVGNDLISLLLVAICSYTLPYCTAMARDMTNTSPSWFVGSLPNIHMVVLLGKWKAAAFISFMTLFDTCFYFNLKQLHQSTAQPTNKNLPPLIFLCILWVWLSIVHIHCSAHVIMEDPLARSVSNNDTIRNMASINNHNVDAMPGMSDIPVPNK